MAFTMPIHHQSQSKLMSLPLEVRHRIYDYLNLRGLWEERQVLRDYLNKLDPQPLLPDDDPQEFDAKTLAEESMRRHNVFTSDFDSVNDLGMGDDGEDDSDGLEDPELDNEELDNDADDDDSNDHGSEVDGSENDELDLDEDNGDEGDDGEMESSTTESQEDDDNMMAAQEWAAHAPDTTEEDASDDTAPSGPPPRQRNKYRHVPYFLYLSECPPTPTTLSICQRVHDEATSHYYNTNSLRIESTTSFRHLTFFEETLKLIANAPFSPFEKMRKVYVRIAWDSEYVNRLAQSSDPAELDHDKLQSIRPILEDSLRLRVEGVVEALDMFAQLREVAVHIYDSKYTPEEVVLHNELLDPLELLCARKGAEIKVVKWELIKGKRPTVGGVIGRLRAELEHFVTSGNDFV